MSGFEAPVPAAGGEGQSEAAAQDDVLSGIDDGYDDEEDSADDDVLSGFGDAPDGSGSDDVLGGFDDAAPSDVDRSAQDAGGRGLFGYDGFVVTGATSIGVSYNVRPHRATFGPGVGSQDTYWGNLSRLRLRQDVQLDADLPLDWKLRAQAFAFYDYAYVIHGRSKYTEDVLEDYEVQAQILDLWVEGRVSSFLDLKLGRQVVNWGRSDTLRVNDILNPLNSREPGLTDIEDLRLPVTMAKADFYWKQWNFAAMVIPEIRYDELPPPGHDFFPAVSLDELAPPDPSWLPILATLPPIPPGSNAFANVDPENHHASQWGSVPELAASLTGIFSGWDVSLYVARVYQNQTSNIINLPDGRFLAVDDKVTMLGAGGNYTWQSWLFKAEAAWFNELDYSYLVPKPLPPGPVPPPLPSNLYEVQSTNLDRFDYMVGAEFYGFTSLWKLTDIMVAGEFAHRIYFGYQPLLQYLPTFQYEHNFETALRVSADAMHARLHLTALGLVLANSDGFLGSTIRLSAEYDIRDGLSISGGLLYFIGDEQVPFDTWEHNDRLFAKLKYSY